MGLFNGVIGDLFAFVGVWTFIGLVVLYIRARAFRRVMANGGTVAKELIDMTWGPIIFWPFTLAGAIKLFGLFPKKKPEA